MARWKDGKLTPDPDSRVIEPLDVVLSQQAYREVLAERETLRKITAHVKQAESCGQGNPLAYVDAYLEIKKLVL